MIRTSFDAGWTVGPKRGTFEAPVAGDRRAVLLPHDALRDLPRSPDSDQGVHAGYYPGGVFEYAKTFAVPEEWRTRTVLLEFEGVYRDAVVKINGDFAAHEPNGYATFVVRADAFLRFGQDNTVTVEARAHKDSRWYAGAGIHRPVHLIVADPVHLAVDGVRVTTPDVDAERAVVAVSATLENGTRHTALTRVRWRVASPDGTTVADGSAPVTVLPGEPATARARLRVRGPRLWGTGDPALYVLRTTVEDAAGAVVDEDTTSFGIRTLQLDAARGLRINGETVKLRGACVHADNGPLGAAAVDAAEDRRIRLLKAAGFNAIRSAHNPISRALLDACDRHGVLVMDELTDVWTSAKTTFDSSLTFPERWRDDVAAMVRKDVNHPSVILYSIGNEILELATPLGSAWSRRIAEAVREDDPTRFVTNGINGIIANLGHLAEAMAEAAASDPNTMMAGMGEQMARMNASDLVTASTEESASVLDVVGFNYADSRYALDAELFPERIIVGSETFPSKIEVMWQLVQEWDHVIGDFTWTGWDYIGEAGIGRVDYTDVEGYEPTGTAGPYPYVLAESGDLDITGHRRTVSYYREIVFGFRSDPWIAVHRPQHHGRPTATTPWSWDDTVTSWSWGVRAGSPVAVDVYADADEVELLLDGASLATAAVGAAPDGAAPGKAFVARFATVYRPGELVAVARRDGAEVGRTALRTAAGEISLVARVDRDLLVDGSADAAFVEITLEDAAGTVPCDVDRLVTVTVEGAGTLGGLATGRARTEEPFGGPSVTTSDGRALAVIRPDGAGTVTVTVRAEGCRDARVVLEVA